jgi:uncharacterized membrane protein
MENETSNRKGCGKVILAIVGFILLLSPLNPFIEYKQSGDDEILTNSSWLVMSILSIIYWIIVLPLIKEKKE